MRMRACVCACVRVTERDGLYVRGVGGGVNKKGRGSARAGVLRRLAGEVCHRQSGLTTSRYAFLSSSSSSCSCSFSIPRRAGWNSNPALSRAWPRWASLASCFRVCIWLGTSRLREFEAVNFQSWSRNRLANVAIHQLQLSACRDRSFLLRLLILLPPPLPPSPSISFAPASFS